MAPPNSLQSAITFDSVRRLSQDLLLDLSFDAIVIRDAQDRIQYWNNGAVEIYGYTPEEALGRVSHDLLKTEFPTPMGSIREALEREGRWSGELIHFRKDGAKVIVSSRWSAKHDEHGNAMAILETNRDITEQKRVQEDLRQIAERFRAVYQHAPTGIAITDLNGRFVQCNSAYETLIGYSEDELRGLVFRDLIHPEDREYNMIFIRRLVAGELPSFTIENRYVGVGGHPVWVQKHVSLMPDSTGRPGFIIALVTDIGERKRVEEQLRKSEEEARARAAELAAVLDAVPSVIFIAHDPECRRITSNREGCEVLRVPFNANASLSAPDEERPSTFRILRDGREQRPEELPMQIAAANGLEVRNTEEQILFDDGTSRDLLGNAVPLFDENGCPRGAVGAFADITERKLAEHKQRESEEKLRLFIEHAPAAIAMFDREMRYLAVSRCWMQDYRLTGDVTGRSHYELFPNLPERWKQVHQRALAGEVLRADEDPFVRADGTTQYIKWQTRPWYAADGSIGGILIAAEDVSERVASQDRLKDSEDKFRTLANSIPQLCWMANPDGYIFWYNDLWYEYTGTTPEEMRGWGWQSVHDPDVLPLVMERWKGAIAAGEPFEMVFPLRSKDGSFRSFLTRVRTMKDEQGRVVRWFGTNTDITEQKRIQEELTRSEALYRATFDTAAVGIAHLSLDGHWLRFNDAICTITGYSREELLTKTFADITHPDDIGADWQEAQRLLTGDISHYAMDKRYIRKDGSIVWVHLTGSVLRDEDGKPERFIGVVEDITRRRLAEQALVQSEKLASAGRLASTIAHEINNPLEVLVNLLYLISSDKELPPHLQEHVQTAEGELNRLSQMARRTLSFYRPQSTPATFAVDQVIEEVLRLFAPTLQGRDVKVSQRLNSNSEVHGTAAEIRQICINLISNAIDASTDSLQVRVSRLTNWKKEDEYAVRITVADTGTGMDRETLKRIFEPFFTTKSQTGTGLGLWVCQEIVRNAGGSIRVRSRIGKGTVFSIYLPSGKAKAT